MHRLIKFQLEAEAVALAAVLQSGNKFGIGAPIESPDQPANPDD
jgi:hypothetical protein